MFFLLIATQADGGTTRPGAILLQIRSVTNIANHIEIHYWVENKTRNPIWVCEKLDWKNDTYEAILYKYERKAVIRIKSFIVPNEILLEEPIYAKYVRLLPSKSSEFKVEVARPILNRSPLKHDKMDNSKLDDIERILLEVGYFDRDLGDNSECCLKTNSPDEVLVNCFWAEKNSEKTLSVEIGLDAKDSR
jgi:hypothetical protein